ncbi:DUF4399 domain-containing protein [Paraliomyxa miuraensis]|uniref:DUF4399 domain-containing protein n=1 Tax=Paraliomyxa miuraensis TaxID=376150 RepID=UPI00224CD932|nr:DUF4399 domain-containing protein [Paraliomyxa miuraensis]MCX4245086.1 DUF4399 domain-containing protein [Paraliomyxa miuraensis]
MKPTATIATLALLLLLPACDDEKKEATRPDLKPIPAKKVDDGKAAEGHVAGRGAPGAPAGRVFFVAPADGAKVSEQFEVEFGLEGKEIEPAGATERDPAKGHHHLLIDTGAIADMQIVPKDEAHLHYGDGATKATVKLPPGKHQLTMQFADGAHRSYGPEWAATITVEVEAGGEPAAADAGQDGAGGG